jgi:tRNA modification GTPase
MVELEGVENWAAVMTPAGRGAVAVVAVSGQAALRTIDRWFRATNGRSIDDQPCDRIVYGQWHDGSTVEEVVLVRGRAAACEIHCHGGDAATRRIVGALEAGGCRLMPWQAASQGESLVQREARQALAEATTWRVAQVLLDQWQGALARAVEKVVRQLEEASPASIHAADRELQLLLERSAWGERLTRPWRIAIAGRPNVGKSCLINALVGYQRSIVFDRPGSTRDVLTADGAVGGWPVRFFDAAGLDDDSDPLASEAGRRARRVVEDADFVLWVIDAATLEPPERVAVLPVAERQMAIAWGEQQPPPTTTTPWLAVVNKIDLVEPRDPHRSCAPVDEPRSLSEPAMVISALHGWGIERLLHVLAEPLNRQTPPPQSAVGFTSRQSRGLRKAAARLAAGDPSAAAAVLRQVLGSQ